MSTATDHYLYQPREVSFETLALCNARCVFCPYETLSRKGTEMPSALIDRIVRELAAFKLPFYVSPFKVNEPLLDQRLWMICEAIEEQVPLARLRLFTNGQPLIPRHLDWIGKLKHLEHLWVSLNEHDPQRYGEVMKLSFATTFARLQLVHEMTVDGAFRHPVVVSRVSDGNGVMYSHRDIEFTDWVRKQWPLFRPQIIKRDGWLGYVEPSSKSVPHAVCGRWWELNICADGVAALCCMDGKGEFAIGNLHTSTLLELYNQPWYVERRMRAKSRAGIEPCQRCTY